MIPQACTQDKHVAGSSRKCKQGKSKSKYKKPQLVKSVTFFLKDNQVHYEQSLKHVKQSEAAAL